MKLKITLLLAVAASSLYGMDVVEKQEITIDWQEREHEYLTWSLDGFLCSEKYWEPLKEGLQSGKIKFEPIEYISPEMTTERGFLAYVGPVEVEGENAILLYPSPLWMYANLVLSKKTARVYAASSDTDPSFRVLDFKQEAKSSLPKGLEINEKYLPGWKTNPRIALWYNKWNNGDDKDLPSHFEKKFLKSNDGSDSDSDSDGCPQFACGIQPILRDGHRLPQKEEKECIDLLKAFSLSNSENKDK